MPVVAILGLASTDVNASKDQVWIDQAPVAPQPIVQAIQVILGSMEDDQVVHEQPVVNQVSKWALLKTRSPQAALATGHGLVLGHQDLDIGQERGVGVARFGLDHVALRIQIELMLLSGCQGHQSKEKCGLSGCHPLLELQKAEETELFTLTAFGSFKDEALDVGKAKNFDS